MSEKCFCHLNGYVVKDATARQEIEQVRQDIEILKNKRCVDEQARQDVATVQTNLTNHNVNEGAHNDIRLLIIGLTNRLNALMDSDDTTLDQLSEIVAYIKNNKTLIDSVTTSKINVTDIIDNLTTNVENKPLSAKQGVILKGLIDDLTTSLTTANEYIADHETRITTLESAGGGGTKINLCSATGIGYSGSTKLTYYVSFYLFGDVTVDASNHITKSTLKSFLPSNTAIDKLYCANGYAVETEDTTKIYPIVGMYRSSNNGADIVLAKSEQNTVGMFTTFGDATIYKLNTI